MFGSSLSLSDCGVAQIERLTKLPLVIPTLPSLQETRDYCFHSFRFPLISVPRTQPLSKLHQVDNIVLQSTCSDWTIFSLGLAEQYCIVRQSCNLLDCQTGRRAGRGVSGTTNPSLGTTCCIAKEQSVAVQSVSIMRARGEQGLVSTGGNPLHSLLHRTHMWIHCTKCDLLWKVRLVPIVDQLSSSPDIMSSPGDLEGDWAHQGKGLFGLRQIARMPIWRRTSRQNE